MIIDTSAIFLCPHQSERIAAVIQGEDVKKTDIQKAQH
jgi:hypothetical protein